MSTVSGRSATLTPAAPMRVVLTVVLGAFVVGGVSVLSRAARGDLEWTATTLIGVPLLALVALASLTGLVAAWTARVWVDHDRNELHQFVVLRDVVRSLDPPSTVRLDYTPTAVGSTVSGTWKVLVAQPDLPVLSVSTPWVSDIADVLRILQPALARNPSLAADDYTRDAIERPDELRRPVDAAGG